MEPITWNQRDFCEVRKSRGDHRGEYPYFARRTLSSGTMAPWTDPNTLTFGNLVGVNQLNLIHNKVVDKVSNDLTPIANLFETIYERDQAYTMLIDAGKGILNFVTGWRKPSYWKSLGKKAKTPSSLPEAWLAYNFGLKPLIGSIDSALNLLGQPFPINMVRGASGHKFSTPSINKGSYSAYISRQDGSYIKELRVYIKPNMNPNAALANVVGLTTPFSTAWSVVPWGWAVDYFVNASQLLSNFENRFPGIQVAEVWQTEYLKCKGFSTFENELATPPLLQSNMNESLILSRNRGSMNYRIAYSFPLIGSNQAANLFSAIALTLKGAK